MITVPSTRGSGGSPILSTEDELIAGYRPVSYQPLIVGYITPEPAANNKNPEQAYCRSNRTIGKAPGSCTALTLVIHLTTGESCLGRVKVEAQGTAPAFLPEKLHATVSARPTVSWGGLGSNRQSTPQPTNDYWALALAPTPVHAVYCHIGSKP